MVRMRLSVGLQNSLIFNLISETLRKYPPQPCLTRVATADCRIPGTNYVVRKGDHVYIPIIGIHYDPEIYPDPDRFDPDRMTTEKMKARHPSSFLPFGMGKWIDKWSFLVWRLIEVLFQVPGYALDTDLVCCRWNWALSWLCPSTVWLSTQRPNSH